MSKKEYEALRSVLASTRCDMACSIDPIAANCYPGTAILINMFGIHDEEKR